MKIILDIQDELEEDEIRIQCRELNDEIVEIQKYLQSAVSKRREIVVYKVYTIRLRGIHGGGGIRSDRRWCGTYGEDALDGGRNSIYTGGHYWNQESYL